MRKFMMVFKGSDGITGRFWHSRSDDLLPDEQDIADAEVEMAAHYKLPSVIVISISEVYPSVRPRPGVLPA